VFACICAVPGLIFFLLKQITLILEIFIGRKSDLFELHLNQAFDLKCSASVYEK
jgi:hypothetical protein